MKQQTFAVPRSARPRSWSLRILSISIFGILFFTLFPYWLDLSVKPAGNRSPFLLGEGLRFGGPLHTSLNMLLFLPFGFALSRFTAARRWSISNSLLAALIAGGMFSYAIEFTQIYIPSRDSAWDDVFSNTAGAVVGMAVGLMLGDFVFRKLSSWERLIESRSSVRGIFVVAVAYFAVWLAASAPLQRQAKLAGWQDRSYLAINDNSLGDEQWSGKVLHFEIWDRPVSERFENGASESAAELAAQQPGLVAEYDSSTMTANRIWTLESAVPLVARRSPRQSSSGSQQIAGNVWWISDTPLRALAESVQQRNQLGIHIDLIPHRGAGGEGTIIALADRAGRTSFSMKQEGTAVVISLATGLDTGHSGLLLRIPGVFADNTRRSIVYNYDGARATLYVDGRRRGGQYYLSPGAALVHKFIRIKTQELVAYSVLYASLIFIPIGASLAFASRKASPAEWPMNVYLALAILLPPVILESVLVWVSRARPSASQLVLSTVLTAGGMLWMNLDRPALSN